MANVFQSLYATAMSIKDTRDNQRMTILNRDLSDIHYSLEVWYGCSHVYTYTVLHSCIVMEYNTGTVYVSQNLLSLFCLY